MQVIPRVHQVDSFGMGRAFLIEGDGLTMIDAGLPRQADKVLALVRKIGRRPEELRRIVITHHHVDHIGSARDLMTATGAELYVHAEDAPYVRGERTQETNPHPGLVSTLLKPAMQMTASKYPTIDWPTVHHEVRDGDEIDVGGKLRAVHVPGHTAGSVAWLWDEQSVLFSGDAVMHALGLGLPFGMFTDDMDQAKRSIARLGQLSFENACFGHGGAVVGGASKKIAAFARRWVKDA